MEIDRLTKFIASYEGFSETAYRDVAGHWTIGYGHKLTPKEVASGWIHRDLSKMEALNLLEADIDRRRRRVVGWLKDNGSYSGMMSEQIDMITSIVFNAGEVFLSSTAAKKIIKNPDDVSIAYEWIEWTMAGGKRLKGLLRRRLHEISVYFFGYDKFEYD